LDLAGGFLHSASNLLVSPAMATINLRLNALVSRHVIALDWRQYALFVCHYDLIFAKKKVRTYLTVLKSYSLQKNYMGN
jgi:hypothetical protein